MKSNVNCQRLNVSKKGFTMVEIVVSLGIFSIVLLAIVSFILWMNYYSAKTKADREAAENARSILNIMTYEIRGAKSIYTPTTTSNQLSLETTRYLPAGQTSTFIDFFICGTALCLKKEFQSPIMLTSDSVNVSALSFSQIFNGSKPSIQINVTIDYKNSNNGTGNYASVSLTSTASLRSY